MRLTVDREAVLALLPPIVKLCSRRTHRPKLSCVLLDAGKTLRLGATDCERWISRETSAVDVLRQGQALVSASDFSAALSLCSGTTAAVEVDGDRLHIRGDREHFKLPGYRASDLPPAPKDLPGEKVGAAAIRFALASVIWSVSSEIRYALNGVGMFGDGRKLEVVASNGNTMAVVSLRAEAKMSVIVPTPTVTLLMSLLGECDEDDEAVAVGSGEGCITVAAAGWTVSSVLVDGTFPPYSDVIPKDAPKASFSIEREPFVAAIRAASLSADRDDPAIQIRISPGDKALRVAATAPERGTSIVNCNPLSVDGTAMTQGYRPAYLLSALGPCEHAVVKFDISRPNGPAVIREGDYLAIVMPRDILCPIEESEAEAVAQ